MPGRSALRYFLIHKPVGMITTLHDPEGRRTVRGLLPPGPRLFPVGRLDADTSGLLLVTNDGDLAHKLMHPRYGVEKRYKVLLDSVPQSSQLARLRAGVTLEPGVRTRPADVRLSRAHRERPTLDVRIHEGRYRQVRRMCEAVGLGVKALHRYGYGPLQLGTLPRGGARALRESEVRRLRAISARPGGVAPRPPMDRARLQGMAPRPPSDRARARGMAPRPLLDRARRGATSRPSFDQVRPRGVTPRPPMGRAPSRPRGATSRPSFDQSRPRGRTPHPSFDQSRPRGRTPRSAFDQSRPRGRTPGSTFGQARTSGRSARPSFDRKRGKPLGKRTERPGFRGSSTGRRRGSGGPPKRRG